MTNDDFVWQEPPPRVREPGNWEPIVKRLKERPGEWAIVETVDKNRSGHNVKRLKDLGCEATSRMASDGKYKIYARWPEQLGEEF